jgi:hypothetical protein
MNELYESATRLTKDNTEKRVESQRLKHEKHLEHIQFGMNKLSETIISKFSQEKIENAASGGFNKAVIYSVPSDEKVEVEESTFPISFLLKGPRWDKGYGWGIRYFENVGISTLMELLNDHFEPFSVNYRYNPKDKVYNFEVAW